MTEQHATSSSYRSLARLMVRGATGPLASFLPLFALPLAGAALLPSDEFAVWSIFATISTLAISLDFGGLNFLMARMPVSARSTVLRQASTMSVLGTLAVGVPGILVWIPYSHLDVADHFGTLNGVLALTVLVASCAGRSVLQILSQAALFDRRFALRNSILLAQAFITFAATVIFAATTESAWSLCLGWAFGTAVTLCFALPATTRHESFRFSGSEGQSFASMSSFVMYRTASSLLGGFLMQADRWIIGAIGGAAALATYEIAWRFATLPRFLVQNLVVVAGTDARSASSRSLASLRQLLDRSMVLATGGALAGAAAVAVAYAALPEISDLRTDLGIFLLLLVAHTFLGITAVISLIGASLEMPSIDIVYLGAAAVGLVCATVFAFGADDYMVFVLGLSASIAASSIAMLIFGRRRILREETSRAI